MEIREKLMDDVKSAMKEKDSLKLNTLRGLQAAIKNREIEMRPNPITGDEVMGTIRRLVKQRKESIEQFEAGGRKDLADQEKAELKILEAYLPAQMDRAKIEAVVTEVIAALGAKSMKDMGGVIKEVQARTAGSADNKTVSEVVRSKLT
jgi:hypothetical protein